MTDDTAALPPEGWYPDPELSGQLRWWDGHQWTPLRPVPQVKAARPVGSGFARLSRAVGILLGLTAVGLLGMVILYVWGFVMFDDAVHRGDLNQLETFDTLNAILSVLGGLGLVATGVCWMVWQYRLARSDRSGGLRRGPGMHAFSWIIPVVGLWFPYQNVKDLWRANVSDRMPGFLPWWWAGWLAFQGLGRVIDPVGDSADSVTEFRVLMAVDTVAALAGLGACTFALRILRTLTAGGLARSAVPVSPASSPAV